MCARYVLPLAEAEIEVVEAAALVLIETDCVVARVRFLAPIGQSILPWHYPCGPKNYLVGCFD